MPEDKSIFARIRQWLHEISATLHQVSTTLIDVAMVIVLGLTLGTIVRDHITPTPPPQTDHRPSAYPAPQEKESTLKSEMLNI